MSVPGSPDDESTTPTDDTTAIDDGAAHTISLTKPTEPAPTTEKLSLIKPDATAERRTVDVEQEDPRYSVTGIAPAGPIPPGGQQFGGPPSYPGHPQFAPPQPGYPPPGRPPRNPVTLMLIGVIVACVVALVVGGIVWWKTSRSDTGVAPLAGQLTKEFPTAPGTAWTYGAGTADAFVSPDPYKNMYSVLDALHDDTTLVTLARVSGQDGYRVVGLNAVTGRSWTLPQPASGCADGVVNHRIACFSRTGVMIVDATTGTVEHSFSIDGTSQLGFDGDNVYTRDGSVDTGVTLKKVTSAGSVVWTRTFPRPADAAQSTGDSASFFVTPTHVVSASGGMIVVAQASDGREVINRGGWARPSVLPDKSLVIATSTPNGQGPTVVVRPDGSTVELAGKNSTIPGVLSADFADTVFVDGRPTPLSTKQPYWATTRSDNPQSIPLATGQSVVLAANGKLTAVDPKTGAMRWSADAATPYYANAAATDGKRLIYATSSGTLTATDVTTGRQEWSVAASQLGVSSSSDSANVRLFVVGDRLVVMTGTQITGFAPTGGTASAPGATTRANTSGDSYVTRCGSTPTFTPEQFTSATGGLVIRMKVTATCADGDVLSGAQTRITVKDGGNVVASGYFNFSGTPLTLPKPDSAAGGSRSVDLTFGPRSFYRLPDTLGSASGGSTSTAGGTTYLVECERGAESAAQAPAPDVSVGAAAAATGPATAPGVDADASVDDALRRQANADRRFIVSNLNNRWVAQLSSKRPGLVAEGMTWTNADILNEFLALRLRFDDVRLLWSDEWPVFSYQGWWVTVAAATFPGPDDANSWCPRQGFDPAHCFAKFVSSTAGPENSTRYWH